MGNLLLNAGGLDGTAGTYVSGGVTLSVDESVIGAPGRAAFVGTGSPGIGGALAFAVGAPSSVAVSAGAMLECSTAFAAVGAMNPPTILLQIFNTALTSLLGQATIPTVSYAQVLGGLSRGLRRTASSAYGVVAAPAAGVPRLTITSAALATGVQGLAMTKPYVGPQRGQSLVSRSGPTIWDPGSHLNPDLQLPCWPSQMPPFQAGALAQPVPNAKAWASDANLPARADLYTALRYELRGRLRLDALQLDILESFYAATRGPFFVLRPDTDQLCIGRWLADGAPKPTEWRGGTVIAEVGLILEVA